jgi:hypothetical protein
MTNFRRIVLLAAGIWVLPIATVFVQQSATKSAPAKETRSPSAASHTDKTRATVQDIMATMISPASKAVFGAVSSEVTPKGTVERG